MLTPEPITAHNRHIICMSLGPRRPPFQITSNRLSSLIAAASFEQASDLCCDWPSTGLVHRDLNEFQPVGGHERSATDVVTESTIRMSGIRDFAVASNPVRWSGRGAWETLYAQPESSGRGRRPSNLPSC
jgi:hypothetical protein